MAHTDWQKVREIFDSALRYEPEERQNFLNAACGEDKILLAEVESLLLSLGSAESFMETPAIAKVADVIEVESKKLETGKCLGHYEIIEQIGKGGMGEVYLAKDKQLERKVAVKILNEEFSQHKSNLNRFIREAKAASSLNHPNILIIHEIGEHQNTNYIVSEFIEGKTLREILRERPLKLSEVLDISIPIADALCTAHSSNIIHRDIKPENVMVRPDGVVKVLDFGLAKLVEQKTRSIFGLDEPTLQQTQTAQGVVLGTVRYMSPEQARGKPVDARTDIFSFGALLYEMLTGQQPFTGETVNHTIVAILEKEPPPVSQFISSYPPEIERIIKTCLAKQADERYSAAKVLLDDLKELKEELAFQSKLERSSAPGKKTEAKAQIIRAATIAETEKRNSIAVLPFTNMSAEAENEYFCDGLAEELLNALAKIEDLKVAARTSAFSFKNRHVEISEIGKTLNVKTVLEGSVRKSGNRLRISVQLVNTADGYHLWSERYDREMRDIFDVQDEITLAVVAALKVKLLGEEKAAILKHYTDNPEAYDLYLKGLSHCYKWTEEGFPKSIEYFEKALEKDPEFALVYSKIADYYHFASHIGLFSPHEILPKWKAAAQRALEIDEGLADAHLAMAHIYFYYDRDWAKAEREFERAVELSPNSAHAHKHYGQFLASREQFERAVSEGRKALELDPLSIAVNFVVGATHFFVDRLDEARAFVQRLTELDSNSPHACWLDGYLLMANGKYEEAVEAFQQSLDLGANQIALSELGCAFGLAGRRDQALIILDQLFEMRERQYAAAFNIARVYAGLGDNDDAFRWMEKAIEERNGELVFLRRFVKAGAGVYLGKTFSTDSRYEDILRRAGLPMDKIALRQATDETNEAHTTSILEVDTTAKDEAATTNIAEYSLAKLEGQLHRIFSTRRAVMYAAVSVTLMLGAFAYLLYWRQTSVAPQAEIKSLAVLPLKSLDAGENYLGLGIADAVIRRINQTGKLIVRPTSAVRRYLNEETDALAAARQLNADAVLEGSVQRADDRLRVSVNLLRTSDGASLWADSFDMKMTDIFTIQDTVAQQVTSRLHLQLDASQQARLMKRYTSNPIAYEFYVRGVYSFDQRGWGDNAKPQMEATIDLFKKAIEADPNFALAHAQLAYAYAWTAIIIEPTKPVWAERAKEEVNRAQTLDSQLAETHLARYLLLSSRYEDYQNETAVRALLLAQQLNPNVGHAELGFLYYHIGLEDLAARELQRALEIDPTPEFAKGQSLYQYLMTGRYDEWLTAHQRRYPKDPISAWYLLGKGRLEEAQRAIEEFSARNPNHLDLPRQRALLFALRGDFRSAEAMIPTILSTHPPYDLQYHHAAHDIACIYALEGKSNQAVRWLREAAAMGFPSYPLFERDAYLNRIRQTPEFIQFMAEMKAQNEKYRREFG